MNDSNQKLQGVFSKNRTEEIGYDVWEEFVVPPFFERLDLSVARKPRVIIGGRGCGKTMLLRYLSHQTLFSPRRDTIPANVVSHIGLYCRADTQFAHAMVKRGMPDDLWQSAFSHWMAITLGGEVLRSLQSIADSKSDLVQRDDLLRLKFSRLRAFDPSFPETYLDLAQNLEDRLASFQMWVNNVRSLQPPPFLPGQSFVLAMIERIKEQLPGLSSATYFAYIDEYENLSEYQQEIVNTALKHSESPLIFNLATKRNGLVTRKTTGAESIMDIAD